MVRGPSLGQISFFFFCNHAFIVFRYKKPRAVLAMERTKPINPKQQQKKVMAPISIHYRAGFSSAGPSATYKRKVQTNLLSCLKRHAHISSRKEKPNEKTLYLSQRKNTKNRGGHHGGREGKGGGGRGCGWREHRRGEPGGGDAYEGS